MTHSVTVTVGVENSPILKAPGAKNKAFSAQWNSKLWPIFGRRGMWEMQQ